MASIAPTLNRSSITLTIHLITIVARPGPYVAERYVIHDVNFILHFQKDNMKVPNCRVLLSLVFFIIFFYFTLNVISMVKKLFVHRLSSASLLKLVYMQHNVIENTIYNYCNKHLAHDTKHWLIPEFTIHQSFLTAVFQLPPFSLYNKMQVHWVNLLYIDCTSGTITA